MVDVEIIVKRLPPGRTPREMAISWAEKERKAPEARG